MATIADLLDERSIDLSLSSGDKDDAIERMVDLVDASGALLDRGMLIKAVRALSLIHISEPTRPY